MAGSQIVRGTGMWLGALVSGASVSAQLRGPVEPATYRSSDGVYELLVDPSSRWGAGPARYRMSRNGLERWSSEHSFTLSDACVTTDGVTVGCAYQEGIDKEGDFIVAVLDPDGTLRTEERVPRVQHGPSCHDDPDPWARGIFLQEPLDRFVVRVADPRFDSQNEAWWVRRLSSGEPVGQLVLHEHMQDPKLARWSTFAEPVPETPLVLSHWDCYRDGRGGRFCLSDLDGRIVWQLDRPLDYELEGGTRSIAVSPSVEVVDKSDDQIDLEREIWRGGAVLALGPGPCFELWFVKDRVRVAFQVRQSAGGWGVEEAGRRPFTLDQGLPPIDPGIAPLPSIELGILGMRWFPAAGGPGPAPVRAVTVGPQGRIYMASGRDGSIHVFDPSSTSPRVIDSTYRNSPQVSWMSVRGDGHLLVGLSTWQCEEFDEEGTHIRSLKGPVFLSFVPGTPRYWGFGGNVAALRDDAGVEVVRLERDAANHWLHFPRTGSVSPDGGLLLLQSELRRGARLNQVHVFDAAGKALNVISLPTSAEPQEVRLAWCGHTVAASTEEELLLFRDDGTPIGRQSLPRAFQEPRGVFFSPDERELWLFSERAEMLRLAVP